MTLSGGKERSQDPIQPVQNRTGQSAELDASLQKLLQEEQQLLRESFEKKSEIPQESITKFSVSIPRLIQRTLSKLDTSRIYQTFKLAGRDTVVHDNRETKKEAKREEDVGTQIAKDSKKTMQEFLHKEGKLIAVKEKSYENFLGDPMQRTSLALEQEAVAERVSKFLTLFEKMLLARFEEGQEMAQSHTPGRFSFLKKTADQWRAFFAHFSRRTVKRKVSIDQLQALHFRGFVQKNQKGTLISDLAMSQGWIEKFARFKLASVSQELARYFAQLEPGEVLNSEQIHAWFPEEAQYLAIKHAMGENTWTPAPEKGKFLGSAKTEAEIAKSLGFTTKKTGGQKKGSSGGGGENFEEEPKERFVPWWQFGPRQERGGTRRYWVIALYLAILGLCVAGVLAIFF